VWWGLGTLVLIAVLPVQRSVADVAADEARAAAAV
jgi:hypothetical protein